MKRRRKRSNPALPTRIYQYTRALLCAYVAIFLAITSATISASPDQTDANDMTQQRIQITRFDDVVAHISNADAIDQARFAKIAIALMIATYETELEHAAVDAPGASENEQRWRAGTRLYIDRLERIAASIHAASMVRIIQEVHGAIRLIIDGEQVMLSAPRPSNQSSFEQSIAENVCRMAFCPRRGTTVEERAAERSAALTSSWVFAQKSPPRYLSSDGLQCLFEDNRHLILKKNACVNLVYEIRLLKEAIATLRVNGKIIDWQHLHIDTNGPGNPVKVTYRSNGSFIRLHLPHLRRAKAVWRDAIPWIKATLQGRNSSYVIKLPAQLVYLAS